MLVDGWPPEGWGQFLDAQKCTPAGKRLQVDPWLQLGPTQVEQKVPNIKSVNLPPQNYHYAKKNFLWTPNLGCPVPF